MTQLRQNLMEKLKEALASVVPITLLVLLLCFVLVPIPTSALGSFLFGAVLLIAGMGLFTLGADMAMTPMGEHLGAGLTKSRRLWLIVIAGFLVGVIITVAEPDLLVLATQVPSVPNPVLIGAVAVGVGLFLVVALLRILFHIPLPYLLIGCYLGVFALSAFVPADFLAVAFDSGGVTTGPMTVPFIMALGVGVASIRSDRDAHKDSFGLVSLCSIGPILAVLLLGLVYRPNDAGYIPLSIPEIADSMELFRQFIAALPHYATEVLKSLIPVVLFFAVFQLALLRLPKHQLIKLAIGLLYTYLGLVLFLTGVNVGFMPVGNYLGKQIAQLNICWILIPIGMVMGYFIVAAEPAVHVLTKQVNELSDGSIPPRAMSLSLSIGVALSLGLAMVRVLTGISIFWFVIPGYAIALGLTFISPKIFTSIAFDSGGVASGPMTATFLLPFAMGASEQLGGNIITDAFGIVAMVAMTPLITIQVLGLYYKLTKQSRTAKEETAAPIDDEIVELAGEDV